MYLDGGNDRIGVFFYEIYNYLGCNMANRSSSTNFNLWCGGQKVAQNSTTMDSVAFPTANIFVFRNGGIGQNTNSKHGCSWTTDGMTDGQINDYVEIVHKYMGNIGRGVKIN